MKRLTYDFCIAGKHCWQIKGADNLECGEVCKSRDDEGCNGCPIANAFDRLAAIEDILGDDYDLDRLRVIVNQRISLRDEVAERFKLTSKIPIDRLQELIQADRDGRCVIRPVKLGTPVWSSVFCRVDDDGIEHPTYPWEFDDSMLAEWGTGWHLTEEDALKTLED